MTVYPEIDVRRARELRASGLSWREVTAILTGEADREPPFHSQSVMGAVNRLYGTLKVEPGWRWRE